MTKSFKKIKNSKGELYETCPDISRVQEILNSVNSIPSEDIFEINQRLERVRKINSELRTSLNNLVEKEVPYNISAIIKTLKIKFQKDPETIKMIDELVKTYF